MAKKIIPASEVKVGDSIRNTFVVADMIVRREGIVAVVGMNGNDLRSKRDYSLGPSSGTIQLLSRPEPPKPVIVLPTGQHAVISYRKANGAKWIGVLRGRLWYFVEESTLGVPGAYEFSKRSESLQEYLTINGRTDYTVHFAGVSK